MNIDTVKVPVEYLIITASDWTEFEIVEGWLVARLSG